MLSPCVLPIVIDCFGWRYRMMEKKKSSKTRNTRHVLGARRSTPRSQGWAAVGIPRGTQTLKRAADPLWRHFQVRSGSLLSIREETTELLWLVEPHSFIHPLIHSTICWVSLQQSTMGKKERKSWFLPSGNSESPKRDRNMSQQLKVNKEPWAGA